MLKDRLARRLLTLIMLVAAFAALSYSPPPQKASASSNCEEACQVMYEHCMSLCSPSCSATAEYRCENKRLNCLYNDCP